MLSSFVVNPLDFTGAYSKSSKPTNTRTNTNPKGAAPSSSPDPQSIIARTALSLEYASLRHQNHCPLGMYVVPSSDLFVWDAVLFVHQGYYAGAVLRFRLTFPNDYPDKMPTIQFVTDIFHPLIDPKGYFNLGAHFRPWKPKEHHIYHVLYHIKAAFKKYRLDQFKEADTWNKEAYRYCYLLIHVVRRYHESTSSFSALATQSSQLTRSEPALYDKDHPSFTGQPGDGLAFQKLSPEKLREYRQKFGLREWVDEPNES
ncbi:UBC-like protein [Macrolepiota fuliginosa MF-IS2]|uniref:UBC-like protein n=1 Tax=Macrolepiota fuliginosa MF-IS2 TaxID=1400762 RepID=A0A9P6C7X6_9AGAR|nr:UBC-like protein [Macrolepiota fuliginosa MF-IS2]